MSYLPEMTYRPVHGVMKMIGITRRYLFPTRYQRDTARVRRLNQANIEYLLI